MKYLLLLFLLLGCGGTPKYNLGECIRLYSSVGVVDFIIRDIFKDDYILSAVFKKDDVVWRTDSKYVFTVDYVEERSRKIDCSEVE